MLQRGALARRHCAHLVNERCIRWSATSTTQPLFPAPPKDMDAEMAASYDPAEVEKGWYAWWETNGMFEPQRGDSNADSAPPFTMVIPPPNVTGSLHIGHALTNTLQDALVRWRRMHGDRVTWVPGLDHAGIATQTVVEKHLKRSGRPSRHELGRAAFVGEVNAWCDQFGGRINHQLRQLGLSLAWSRAAFTLDAPRSHAVTTAFVRLHADGLLFRDVRMVHWCAHLRTVISDIEVDHVDVAQRTKHRLPNGRTVDIGVMHRIRYTVVDAGGAPIGELEVDTTRPETMLADQAVAIHPQDERYAAFRGMRVLQPLTNVSLPLVCDPVLVDMAIGTGAVKITPAHDANDFECAKRHGLSTAVSMLNDDGTISGDEFVPRAYRGMHRFECRDAVIKALTASGRYVGARNHAMRVAVCSRSGDIVEPRLKPQWFVRCDALNERARAAVATGALALVPAARAADWDRWLSTDASRVWCVSRQLWWGHRIPAWRVVAASHANEASPSPAPAATVSGGASAASVRSDCDNDRWFVAHTETEARALASAALGVPADRLTLAQDDDVLDTWFSSGLFPLSTFGWPSGAAADSSSSLSSASAPASLPGYPLSTMITGRDIMFFWVARMVLLCSYLAPHKQLPFPQAVLHPLIRGSDGRKMSKSLGNVIDPCELMEGRSLPALLARLKESNLDPKALTAAETLMKKEYPHGMKPCGADALRLALIGRVNLDEYISLDYKRVLACRQLGNKIWQAARFVRTHTNDAAQLAAMSAVHSGTNIGGSGSGLGSPNHVWQSAVRPARVSAVHADLELSHRWVLHHLAATVAACDAAMRQLQWRVCAEHLQAFFVGHFCDVFIEFCKPTLQAESDPTASSPLSASPSSSSISSSSAPSAPLSLAQRQAHTRTVLLLCLETFLRLLHPSMPYLTEELWHRLPSAVRSATAASISLAAYPRPEEYACFLLRAIDAPAHDAPKPHSSNASADSASASASASAQLPSASTLASAPPSALDDFDSVLAALEAFRALIDPFNKAKAAASNIGAGAGAGAAGSSSSSGASASPVSAPTSSGALRPIGVTLAATTPRAHAALVACAAELAFLMRVPPSALRFELRAAGASATGAAASESDAATVTVVTAAVPNSSIHIAVRMGLVVAPPAL